MQTASKPKDALDMLKRMDLSPGYLLGGKYRVVRKAGAGGMADLYQVEHTELEAVFALKVLRPVTGSRGPQIRRYFLDEARALAKLRHPGVPFIVDMGVIQEHPYLLMEWLDGEPLSDLLQRDGQLELSRALNIAGQVGAVLVAAHSLGIVHRDLKPDNIFLCKRPDLVEAVRVLDFGIARVPAAAGAARPQTQAGIMIGTIGYMSPEQARGDAPAIGPHTDQYLLATLIYRLLEGRTPFSAIDHTTASMQRFIIAINTEPPPSFSAQVGQAVQRVLLRALAIRGEERFPSVSSFLSALEEARLADIVSPTQSGRTPALNVPARPAPPALPAPAARLLAVTEVTPSHTEDLALPVPLPAGPPSDPDETRPVRRYIGTQPVETRASAGNADPRSDRALKPHVPASGSPSEESRQSAKPTGARRPVGPIVALAALGMTLVGLGLVILRLYPRPVHAGHDAAANSAAEADLADAQDMTTEQESSVDLASGSNEDLAPVVDAATPRTIHRTPDPGSNRAGPGSTQPLGKPFVAKPSPPSTVPPAPLQAEVNIVGLNANNQGLSPLQKGLLLRAVFATRICEPRRRISLVAEKNQLRVTTPWPERLSEGAANELSNKVRTLWLEQPTVPETPMRVLIVCLGN